MDSLIAAAGRALALGDPLTALKHVALRGDPPALALRGIAMAQLGDLPAGRALLRSARRAFAPQAAIAQARCVVAEAEIALVLRDLGGPFQALEAARALLDRRGDRPNAAHAGYLMARRLLLIGRLDEAAAALQAVEVAALAPASQAGYWLVAAGLAQRRVRAAAAWSALREAQAAAERAGVAPLSAEVDRAARALAAPAARRVGRGGEQMLDLAATEAVFASQAFVVDALRSAAALGERRVALAARPVLFALLRRLAEAWPADVSREVLVAQAFGGREADESHRARLRVEIGRLRQALARTAWPTATPGGYRLETPEGVEVVVLAPPVERAHPELSALLADGEAWSSSALAVALGVSARTVQRALEALAAEGEVEAFGAGRSRRWRATSLPGFPTGLLLPARPADP